MTIIVIQYGMTSRSISERVERLAVASVGITAAALASSGGDGPELTLAQWRALVLLNNHPALRVTDLAGMLGTSLPSASRLLRRLERRGLLTTNRDEDRSPRDAGAADPEGESSISAVMDARRQRIANALRGRRAAHAGGPGRRPGRDRRGAGGLRVRERLPSLRDLRTRIRRASYLRKWVLLGALIGVIGGVGATVFTLALDLGTKLFLGLLAGYAPPSPVGEGGLPITDAARPWMIPLVVGLGGLIAGIIVFRWAPEAEGHGTDAAIAAFHHHPRRIRARIPLVKLVASAITIGSGGSGGREGPTAQISAGFGSFLSRVLDLDARDARIAVAAGMAAGIGAIFRAPLGGAILGAEILYRDDVESDALVPAFIASIVAYSIFGVAVGFDPIFGLQTGARFADPRQLVYYARDRGRGGAGGPPLHRHLLWPDRPLPAAAPESRCCGPRWPE